VDSKRAIEQAFAEMAPRYEQVVDSELRLIWGWSYQEFVDQLIQSTSIEDNDIVLDIATGTGVIPLRLSKERSNGNRYIGLDITPAMLQHARHKVQQSEYEKNIRLTCASAMDIPFRNDSFNQITCGLATHHMDTSRLIAEMIRVLRPGGRITIADVGASPSWKFPLMKTFIRMIAFVYFLPAEGYARAWAEANSISNMMTAREWEAALAKAGFTGIRVNILKSRNFWAPAPIALNAIKHNGSQRVYE
jgi:ubiquinone/menaquinone biosynthesis C-methylase UbiE